MDALKNYHAESRPWGKFERFTLNEQSTVKLITVKAGEAFSLQKHAHRSEFWHVISGKGVLTHGIEKLPISAGLEVFVGEGDLHRVEAGDTDVLFLEVAFGTFDEGDIERLDDKYGR